MLFAFLALPSGFKLSLGYPVIRGRRDFVQPELCRPARSQPGTGFSPKPGLSRKPAATPTAAKRLYT